MPRCGASVLERLPPWNHVIFHLSCSVMNAYLNSLADIPLARDDGQRQVVEEGEAADKHGNLQR